MWIAIFVLFTIACVIFDGRSNYACSCCNHYHKNYHRGYCPKCGHVMGFASLASDARVEFERWKPFFKELGIKKLDMKDEDK